MPEEVQSISDNKNKNISFKKVLLIAAFVILVLICLGLGSIIFISYQNQQSWNFKLPEKQETSTKSSACNSLQVSGYQLTNEIQADLKNDGKVLLVRVYYQSNPPNNQRTLAVVTKVFSENSGCFAELFSYNGKGKVDRSGNELAQVQLLKNFWGDGKDVVLVSPNSTGYGSGSTSPMNFITWTGDSFKVVEGPILNELSLYKFNDSDPKGSRIIVAEGIWNKDEGHFNPHRYKFTRYDWSGSAYTVKTLGETVNKYPSGDPNTVTIDQILKDEPQVLQ